MCFANCTSLVSITIPAGVEKIVSASNSYENGAFFGCTSLAEVRIADGLKEIGAYAFYGCDALRTVYIPASVEVIGDGAFESLELESVYYGGTLESWLAITFTYGANPMNCTENFYFTDAGGEYYQPTELVIPSSVKEIGEYALANLKLVTRLVISDGVVLIGSNNFCGFDSLTEILLPTSLAFVRGWNNSYYPDDEYPKLYYLGSKEDWECVKRFESYGVLANTPVYFYSEAEPSSEELEYNLYWCYDKDGNAKIWNDIEE